MIHILLYKKDSSHYTSIRQNSQKRMIEVVRGNISAFPASTIRPLSHYSLWRGSSRIQQLWWWWGHHLVFGFYYHWLPHCWVNFKSLVDKLLHRYVTTSVHCYICQNITLSRVTTITHCYISPVTAWGDTAPSLDLGQSMNLIPRI